MHHLGNYLNNRIVARNRKHKEWTITSIILALRAIQKHANSKASQLRFRCRQS